MFKRGKEWGGSKNMDIKEALRDGDVSSSIEDVISARYESGVSNESISKLMGCDPEDITEEEVKIMKKYVRHAGKRLLLSEIYGSKERILKKIDNHHINSDMPFKFHDIIHTAIEFNRTDGRSFVPRFISAEKEINDVDAIRDELIAALWRVFGNEPIFLALRDKQKFAKYVEGVESDLVGSGIADDDDVHLLLEEMKRARDAVDGDNFESVFDAYQKIVLVAVKRPNMRVAKKKQYDESRLMEVSDEYDSVAHEIISNPKPELIELAKRIFEEYPENKRILMDIFMELIAKLVPRFDV